MTRKIKSLIITIILTMMFVITIIGIFLLKIILIIGGFCIGSIFMLLTQSIYEWSQQYYIYKKEKKLSNIKDKDILDFEYEEFDKKPEDFIDIEDE